ncbi:centrosomal P4.1-associated protein [Nerophis lumbriciformis]|uniref:centrosomal P4.1-associated protein n=1 Tax=Nerophis lumbriciformis TaxID=546530 RepID=UPI002ADF7A75|nr:centromere protein J-like [Nerophis lumbriciformis]XP_061782100.1 centromere protein J-like [Nerophis lumbriciformis]
MLSPAAGLPYAEVDFLSRWLPCSSKAGVILNAGPDLLQYTPPWATPATPPQEPDEGDSCSSDFAPLATSVDSSCLDPEDLSGPPGGDMPGSDSPGTGASRTSQGEAAVSHHHSRKDPVTAKLEKLRTWQKDMQDSLDAASLRQSQEELQDRPIKAGEQTFEELLEEQLMLEEQRLKEQKPDGRDSTHTKRAFLRRGQGLSRFTNKDGKTPPKAATQPRNSESGVKKASQQPLPVQRKTATLNKENRPRETTWPPQNPSVKGKAVEKKVLGCHQRQNTDRRGGVAGAQSDPAEVRPVQPAETKQAGVRAQASGARVRLTCGPRTESGGGVPQESFEASFVEKEQRWECERQLENVELGEFELLEKAAEEFSFSSNSSFVAKLLQMDHHNRKLLGAASLHQRRLSSTPIKSPPAREQRRSLGSGDAVQKSKVNFDHKEDTSSAAGGDSKEADHGATPPCFPAPPQPVYNSLAYQDEDSCQGSDGGESDATSSIDSTLTEDKEVLPDHAVFHDDDHDAWNDLDDTAVHPVSTGAANQEPAPLTPPPPSKLMLTLFPSLRPKTQNAPLPPAPQDKKTDEEAGQSIQAREKLEIEMECFKKNNEVLARLRQELEKTREKMRKESEAWEQQKAEQQADFEQYKKEEVRRLQKERKVFETHASALRAAPGRKEREEIQKLKEQLSGLQEEQRKKESRWSSAHSRLRQQIDLLSQENLALRNQVSVLEKLRVSALKKKHVGAERSTKDAVPSSIKGVTFASPLDSRRSVSPPHRSTAAAARGSPKDSNRTAPLNKTVKSSLRAAAESPSPSTSSPSSSSSSSSSLSSSSPSNKKYDPELSQSCSPQRDVTPSEEEEEEEEECAQDVVTHLDGKVEKVLASGDRVILFPNGTRKEISSDGVTVKVAFFNGDTKEVTADQRVMYYYADTQTTHITYPDGTEVLHFPNRQTETHFPDGRKEITFANQTVKNLFPDGSEESVLTDGTVMRLKPDGTKEIYFNTGQKEVHTADYKRREYPDGTVKTVYADGSQETRYPTGRTRLKDKDGNVVADSKL